MIELIRRAMLTGTWRTPGSVHPSGYTRSESYLWAGRWRAAVRWGYPP